MPDLTIVGLGPGPIELLTRRAENLLRTAAEVVVSRPAHPVAAWLTASSRPIVALESVAGDGGDYSSGLIERTKQNKEIVLAAPGNPLVDEPLVASLLTQARAAKLAVDVVPGLSYVDSVTELGAIATGSQLVRPAELAVTAVPDAAAADPFRGVYRDLDPTRPTFVGPLFDDAQLDRAERWLARSYPADQPIVVVVFPRTGEAARRVETSLNRLEHLEQADFARCVVVQPLERLRDLSSFDTLRYIVAQLRAPTGCPWDREQTYASIKKHLVEETYEAIAALDEGELATFAGELGDVLLQVVMYAQFGREAGDFTLEDVLSTVNEKLIRRHPHVFGDVAVGSSADVLRNWEKIKRAEKPGTDSTFSGVPEAAPALVRADAVQSRATRYGWIDPVDLASLVAMAGARGGDAERQLGDLLFDVVALARRHHVDAEGALRLATNHFRDAFDKVLAICRMEGTTFEALTPEERRRRLSEALGIPSP
jgi:tetrapyrrole methylase family protein/MazG family protein